MKRELIHFSRQNKYGNKKTEVDGILFDSKREALRWIELKYMERAGLIKNLKRQVKFCLIPTIEGEGRKVRQRAVYYVADFEYWEKAGEKAGDRDIFKHVVEDAKGVRTDVYKIKKKLMLWIHGIEIKEV